MRRIILAAVVPLALLALGSSPAGAGNGNGLPAGAKDKSVCAKANAFATAGCDAKVVTFADGVTPFATTGPTGYGPADLQGAYKLPSVTAGSGATVAIVDAYANPNVVSDLAAYRSRYGLPACGAGCFTVVNQNGQAGPLPAGDTGWGQEIDLDVDMVSAVCPQCKILLVEASSNSFADLGAAVNTAARTPGVVAISNSYGTSSEFSGETSYDSYYNHPGLAVTASSGDSGYGVEFPAADNHVVAVGGTNLVRSTSTTRGWSESAWNGAGSGCSAYFGKPSWQSDSGCSRRMEADVSAVADPNTGVSVYDSYGSTGGNNWYVFGGTSVASPIIAAVYALGGNTGGYPAQYTYGHASSLFDVIGGSNGSCSGHGKRAGQPYFCQAVAGYDGPTGLGTPNGTGGF
ncbi:MAG: peptidase S8 [Gaiellaceae bacterium]|jgi:subtilase family serine protease|nr:S53 family peptidase [Acidobacteriota bacterium]